MVNKENYGVNDIKTLEGIEAIRLRPGIEEYIHLFNYLITKYDCSFVKFTNNEKEEDKVDILRFFKYLYPNYNFCLSVEKTAFIYKNS